MYVLSGVKGALPPPPEFFWVMAIPQNLKRTDKEGEVGFKRRKLTKFVAPSKKKSLSTV